eukprot:2017411-Ditylum_brightwellii.AAC.1
MARNGSGVRSTNVKACTMAFICPRPMTMQNGKRIATRSRRRSKRKRKLKQAAHLHCPHHQMAQNWH